jgi:hypothetical protein
MGEGGKEGEREGGRKGEREKENEEGKMLISKCRVWHVLYSGMNI